MRNKQTQPAQPAAPCPMCDGTGYELDAGPRGYCTMCSAGLKVARELREIDAMDRRNGYRRGIYDD